MNRGYGDKSAVISLIRLIAMLLIITCHIFQIYSNELCYYFNVGVQIFLIISGYLYSFKTYDSPLNIIIKQFKKILFPYYILLNCILLAYIIFIPSSISIESVSNAVFCSGTLEGQGHLWFIPYILFCYLITPYLYWLRCRLENKHDKVFVSVCILLILFLIISKSYHSYFRADIISCYILGYFFKDFSRRYLTDKGRHKMTIITVIVTIVLIFIRIYIDYIGNIQLNGFTDSLYYYFKSYSHVLLGFSIFLSLFTFASKVQYCKILHLSDKYSYLIYLVHGTFILSPLNVMFVTSNLFINILIALICTIISAVILYEMTEYLSSKIGLNARKH